MMSGCGILTNGKGTRREYCEFSLDELQVQTHKYTLLILLRKSVFMSDFTHHVSGGRSYRFDA